MACTVLMVAEKPSLAGSIAGFLSHGKSEFRRTALDVHEWSGQFKGQPALFRMTSVIGHVYSLDFPAKYNSWDKTDPATLFEAETVKMEANPKAHVCDHLQREARGCDYLVLWLDCDREGENICFEVMDNVVPRLNPLPSAVGGGSGGKGGSISNFSNFSNNNNNNNNGSPVNKLLVFDPASPVPIYHATLPASASIKLLDLKIPPMGPPTKTLVPQASAMQAGRVAAPSKAAKEAAAAAAALAKSNDASSSNTLSPAVVSGMSMLVLMEGRRYVHATFDDLTTEKSRALALLEETKAAVSVMSAALSATTKTLADNSAGNDSNNNSNNNVGGGLVVFSDLLGGGVEAVAASKGEKSKGRVVGGSGEKKKDEEMVVDGEEGEEEEEKEEEEEEEKKGKAVDKKRT
mmetsp:Transcript_15133/g.26858  ORF Transcript_15133/g.26858 Transcript_15133/m.26858 type:complete len:405 (-) Transcript_15133:220-1434(-)